MIILLKFLHIFIFRHFHTQLPPSNPNSKEPGTHRLFHFLTSLLLLHSTNKVKLAEMKLRHLQQHTEVWSTNQHSSARSPAPQLFEMNLKSLPILLATSWVFSVETHRGLFFPVNEKIFRWKRGLCYKQIHFNCLAILVEKPSPTAAHLWPLPLLAHSVLV